MTGKTKVLRALRLALTPYLGKRPDTVVATVYGIEPSMVRYWREAAGIPACPVDHAACAAVRGDALRECVMRALYVRQGSRSSEVHARVVDDFGSVSLHQVQNVLRLAVAAGKVTRDSRAGAPLYRKVKED